VSGIICFSPSVEWQSDIRQRVLVRRVVADTQLPLVLRLDPSSLLHRSTSIRQHDPRNIRALPECPSPGITRLHCMCAPQHKNGHQTFVNAFSFGELLPTPRVHSCSDPSPPPFSRDPILTGTTRPGTSAPCQGLRPPFWNPTLAEDSTPTPAELCRSD
jgi:hypothetical protein